MSIDPSTVSVDLHLRCLGIPFALRSINRVTGPGAQRLTARAARRLRARDPGRSDATASAARPRIGVRRYVPGVPAPRPSRRAGGGTPTPALLLASRLSIVHPRDSRQNSAQSLMRRSRCAEHPAALRVGHDDDELPEPQGLPVLEAEIGGRRGGEAAAWQA